MAIVLRRLSMLVFSSLAVVMVSQECAPASLVGHSHPPAKTYGLRAGDTFRTTSDSESRVVTYSFEVVNDSRRDLFIRLEGRSQADMTIVRKANFDAIYELPSHSRRQVTVAYHIGSCKDRILGYWPIPFEVGQGRTLMARVSVSPPLAGRLQWQEYLVSLICR